MKGRLLVLAFLIYLIYLIVLFTFFEKFLKRRINSIEELDSIVNTTEFEDYDLELEEEKFIRTLFKGDECLLSKYKTKNVLKKIYSSTDISVDQNLRFILGKCNPVLLVPGIYATELMQRLIFFRTGN